MEAQKFIGEFGEPCNFHANSEQAKQWQENRPMLPVKIFVKDGKVWLNKAKHYTGVINQRVAGGKWELYSLNVRRGHTLSIDDVLSSFNAKPADYRGQPKTK